MGPGAIAAWSCDRWLCRSPVLGAMSSIEVDGACETFAQVHLGLPLEDTPQLAVVDVDGADVDDLSLGRKWLQSVAARSGDFDEQLGDLAQADRFDRADVEDLTVGRVTC